MKYHIWTIGCQMNVADSRRVAAALEKLGYTPSPRAEEADVVWGFSTDPNFTGRVQLTLLVTGVGGVPLTASAHVGKQAERAAVLPPKATAPAAAAPAADLDVPAFLRRRLRSTVG
jgi:hypothetical protein